MIIHNQVAGFWLSVGELQAHILPSLIARGALHWCSLIDSLLGCRHKFPGVFIMIRIINALQIKKKYRVHVYESMRSKSMRMQTEFTGTRQLELSNRTQQ
jgi:hypothetical protein